MSQSRKRLRQQSALERRKKDVAAYEWDIKRLTANTAIAMDSEAYVESIKRKLQIAISDCVNLIDKLKARKA